MRVLSKIIGLLYNSSLRLFPGKLKLEWLGPFIVKEVSLNGAVNIQDPGDAHMFKVNEQRLKNYGICLNSYGKSVPDTVRALEP